MSFCGWRKRQNNKQKVEVKDDTIVVTPKITLSKSTTSATSTTTTQTAIPTASIKSTAENSIKKIPSNQLNYSDVVEENINEKTSGDECNPRNKCALKPGHSLMDWIRLGTSGVDLSGTRGIINVVSHIELAKHNKQTDGWLAIRGKVYNVTHYMDFHPGGVDEIMKGVGKDATKLFEEVHAWVNFEQLLAKCFVGPLKNTATLTLDQQQQEKSLKLSPNLNERFKMPSFKLSNSSPDISSRSQERLEIIPRFDWIQKTTDLTIVFYTKSLCNPGLIIEYINDNEIDVRILLDKIIHLCQFKFCHYVRWPCITKITMETGKIELIFTKSEPALWTNFGTLERRKIVELEDIGQEYDVANRTQITNDSYALVLKPKKRVLQVYPLGYHVNLTVKLHGTEVTRSYTPVPSHLINGCPASCLALLVKSYNNGLLSKYITRTNPLANSITVFQSYSNFSLYKLKNHSRIGLLAAGSGITPMLQILDYLIERTSNKLEAINFLLFNKTESDIWCRQKLDNLSRKNERLKIIHILSEPNDEWTGERGRITNNLVNTLIDQQHSNYVTYCCVCGPTSFNDLTLNLLKDVGYETNEIHCFNG